MDTIIFIALINPGMSLIFAVAFFVLWRHRKERRYIAVMSASFLALGLGFLLQYFTLYSITISKLLSNLLLLGGSAGFAMASLARFKRNPPLRAMGIVTAIGFVVFLWFLLVDHNITMRIYAINFTVAAIMLVLAGEMRQGRERKLIDNLLMWQLYFWSATFIIRPIIVVWIEGPYVDYVNFHQSLYWITLTYSASLFLLMLPLTQTTAIALDVMEELRHESCTDSLSGLLNRRGFEAGAASVLQKAGRRQVPVSLILSDLDHFKSINDTYGHACGDTVIVTFGHCLQRGANRDHLVGRLGGEEFGILLDGACLATARLVAEGMRTAFSSGPIPGLPDNVRLSASFGVAEYRPGEPLSDLIQRADAALYEAKKAGRNRVSAFRPGERDHRTRLSRSA